MATSGVQNFNPSFGDLVLFAFRLCGLQRTELLQQHMVDAGMSANLLQSDWLNRGVNLWQVQQYNIMLVEGQGDYNLDPLLLSMLDTYVVTGSLANPIDRLILPVSRSEYASYPNKLVMGFPTVYWMERLLAPVVHLWPVPDGYQLSLKFYGLRQAQDAAFSSDTNVEIPYAWLNAFAHGLALKLAVIYAPDRLSLLQAAAKDAYDTAAAANVEQANQYIAPQLSGYWRV